LFEDGQPVRVVILRRNVLIGGTTGAGKSGIVNVILAYLVACADVIVWGVDLKGGMELQPWAGCMEKLATTPREATALFRDAVTEVDRRAAIMTRKGERTWEPTPANPARLVVVDEYAEMPDDVQDDADSLARRGRAVAANMLAATQRPTQDAMGRNAVRSQMDVRICLRVRERRDVDLILGQGSFAAGWHAHALTQPGAFLISAPEFTSPERARGYLITGDQVSAHAARHARRDPRPPGAGDAPGSPQTPATPRTRAQGQERGPGAAQGPDSALWAALLAAPPEGREVWVLMAACGMSRSWVYRRLAEHADAGRAVQVTRGCWRAATPPGGHAT
jgi:S-DNA-T family DNA segregation ATPase FtsK/SpoIIIE